MPNFENIDEYEARNPKSGNKEIIPIAPHSLQASDYRPRKSGPSQVKIKEKVPAFPEVEIEPVSIQQMEKEYRQAGRQLNRQARQSRSSQSLWKRLKKWLQSLLKSGKGRPPRPRPDRRSSQRPSATARKGRPRPGPQGKSEGQENRDQNRNKRRRRRPQDNRGPQGNRGPQDNRGPQGGNGPQGGGQEDKAPHQRGDQEGAPKKRSRNRRNRSRRGPRGGQKGNPDSGNPQ